jgi:hypothetical protein
VHVTPPSHVDIALHKSVQVDPPHSTGPAHALDFMQSIAHSDACEQSIPPLHADVPHVTSHGMLAGHVTSAAHELVALQSITHVSP